MKIHLRPRRVLGVALCAVALMAANTPPKPEGAATDPGWPREFTDGKAKLVLYQPQVDSWKDFDKLKGRLAAALTPAKGAPTAYGTITLEADTRVDLESRIVSYADFHIMEIQYPKAADAAEEKKLVALTKTLFPQAPTSIALDRILAYIDVKDVKPRQVEVSMEPPPILVSTQPAILVILDGKPLPVDIEKTDLQKIVNTNWDLFFDKDEKRYYLRNDQVWLSAKALEDAWMPVTKLPKSFTKLPDSEEYLELRRAALSPKKPTAVSLVLVVYKPSELILLSGEPVLTPVPETQLMWVSNCEGDLFFDSAARNYYLLTSGRWFRTPDLKSQRWEAATTSLPADFAKIPADHPRAHVLAAVPGTRQAELAVLAASIPEKGELDRKSATAKVDYVGDPKFDQIAGTNMSYAVNTPNDVIKIGESYYLCFQGAWFIGTSANGPWVVTDKVPDEIYTIPTNSPKHNVTYVQVYESTPETVTYGYTSGYTGMYVSFGVAMWGTGYYYPYYYGYGMYGYPAYWAYPYYTYGASAWYNPVTGAYGRGSAVYGPYGGYARGAAYNPSTGRYSWGQKAYGPYGGAATGGFYNPSTGGWGASARASNGYQSWGTSVVGRGDKWARGASYSDSRGTVGAIQGSGGGKAIGARGSNGQSGFVGKSGSGDIYAGRDGNVYKRDQGGGWSKNSGSGSWESVSRPAQGAQPGTMDRSGGGRTESVQTLNRDASARQSGNSAAQRSQSASPSRSYSGSRGGGGFSRGGGGRRR